jgi:uncharacterized repeat protein (TIGR01451 family)
MLKSDVCHDRVRRPIGCNRREKVHLRLGQWAIALTLTLTLGMPHTVCAQSPADLRLDKRADAQRVPGDKLVFTLTLTNEGATELDGLVVSDVTPAGTAFMGASGPRDWMITTPRRGGEGEILWRSTAPLQPDESVALEFVVTVQSQAGPSLESQGCTVKADGWADALVGPTVTVDVLTSTSTSNLAPVDRPSKRATLVPALGGLLVISVAVLLFLGRRRRMNR